MKLAILSRNPRLYSSRRLKEAAEKAGHKARVLDTLAFSIDVESGDPELYYKGKQLSTYDAIIPRIGASITLFGTAVVRQFEQMGVYSVNTSHAIAVSRDKLRSIQVLSRHRIGFPKTAFVHDLDRVVPTIEAMGGPPLVIKLLQGTQGIGVILADTTKIAQSIIEVLQGAANQNVLIQDFVAESKGRDIRAFVVGNRVVAAMRRIAQGDEFRSNIHRGGRAEPVELDPEYTRTAVHAAQIMGLRVAGVDMLEGKDGPLVMEINSSPGLEGIETVTGVDVAGEIIQLIQDEVLFPDIDLRQRLTVQSGYGVMEVRVDERSSLANRSIRESQLRERDVMILTIQRGGVVIPNPRATQTILAGDILLCFGKTITLKSYGTPNRKKRKKKKKGDEDDAPGTNADSGAAPSDAGDAAAPGNAAGGDDQAEKK
jgi:ribosomal protein S6--L-glutamate ligase